MSSVVRHTRIALIAVAALATLAGCAGSQKEKFVTERASQHVYNKPIDEVWEQARVLLREEGFGLREVAGGYELVTDEKEGQVSTMGSSFIKVYAKGQKVGADGCTVQFMRYTRTTAGERGGVGGGREGGATADAAKTRDVVLEWKLLQRVDPEQAKKIEAEANAKFN